MNSDCVPLFVKDWTLLEVYVQVAVVSSGMCERLRNTKTVLIYPTSPPRSQNTKW